MKKLIFILLIVFESMPNRGIPFDFDNRFYVITWVCLELPVFLILLGYFLSKWDNELLIRRSFLLFAIFNILNVFRLVYVSIIQIDVSNWMLYHRFGDLTLIFLTFITGYIILTKGFVRYEEIIRSR